MNRFTILVNVPEIKEVRCNMYQLLDIVLERVLGKKKALRGLMRLKMEVACTHSKRAKSVITRKCEG